MARSSASTSTGCGTVLGFGSTGAEPLELPLDAEALPFPANSKRGACPVAHPPVGSRAKVAPPGRGTTTLLEPPVQFDPPDCPNAVGEGLVTVKIVSSATVVAATFIGL